MAQEEPQFSDFPVGTIVCVKGQSVPLCVRSHKEVKERKLVLCTWFDKQGLMHNDALPIEMLERWGTTFPAEPSFPPHTCRIYGAGLAGQDTCPACQRDKAMPQYRPAVITLKEHD